MSPHPVRADYQVIAGLVEPGSQVLDLGCGDGELLELLQEKKQIVGRGIELDEENVMKCFQRGLSVIHGNVDMGLMDYDDKVFDYVILDQTVQVVHRPSYVLEEMLRVGNRGILCFPNFAHWALRLDMLVNGRMPKSEALPYPWYDTPNIHLLTIKDFREYCAAHHVRVLDEYHLSSLRKHKLEPVRFWPNLRAEFGIS